MITMNLSGGIVLFFHQRMIVPRTVGSRFGGADFWLLRFDFRQRRAAFAAAHVRSQMAFDEIQIQCFDFLARPRRAAQEFQAGFHTWIAFETVDVHLRSQRRPAEVVHQGCQQFFQRDAVQRIFRRTGVLWCISHQQARSTKFRARSLALLFAADTARLRVYDTAINCSRRACSSSRVLAASSNSRFCACAYILLSSYLMRCSSAFGVRDLKVCAASASRLSLFFLVFG